MHCFPEVVHVRRGIVLPLWINQDFVCRLRSRQFLCGKHRGASGVQRGVLLPGCIDERHRQRNVHSRILLPRSLNEFLR